MRMLKLRIMKAIFAMVVFVAVMPKIVWAYLDPGSGSYLLQMILGVVLGGIYFFRNSFKILKDKIASFVKKIFKK